MKFFIIFACALAAASAGHLGAHIAAPIAPVWAAPQHLPVIGPNGVPVDTPAVQHATAAHLAHKVEAHARNGDWAVAPVIASTYAHGAPIVASSIAHHGIVAQAPIVAHQPAAWPTTAGWPTNVNGVPLETPEVVAAKTNHFAAHAEAHARNGNYAIAAPIVGAPLVASTIAHHRVVAHAPIVAQQAAAWPTTAVLPSSVNGVPLETPEVVAAKSHHFAAHAEALTRNAWDSSVIYRHRRGVIAPLALGAHTYGAIGYGALPYSAHYGHYY